jgi:hypothetical protein
MHIVVLGVELLRATAVGGGEGLIPRGEYKLVGVALGVLSFAQG